MEAHDSKSTGRPIPKSGSGYSGSVTVRRESRRCGRAGSIFKPQADRHD